MDHLKCPMALTLLVSTSLLAQIGCNAPKTDDNVQNKSATENADKTDDQVNTGENSNHQKPDPVAVEKDDLDVLCESDEGCKCGATACPKNARCNNNQCVCGNTVIDSENAGYECLPIVNEPSMYEYDLFCKEKDGCKCGKITSAVHMGCSDGHATCAGQPVPGRGLACRNKPHNGYTWHLACFKNECDCYGNKIKKNEICERLDCPNGFNYTTSGCICDRLTLNTNDYVCSLSKDNKNVNVCINDNGCECGNLTCPVLSVCRKGACLDRISLQPLPENYTIVNGLPQCNEDSCACAQKVCEHGNYCINGTCYNDPYIRKLDGKYYYFRFNEFFDTIKSNPDLNYVSFDDVLSPNAAQALMMSLLFVDPATPICHPDFKFSNGATLSYMLSEAVNCNNDEIKTYTVGDLLKNCGAAAVTENVADKYCHLNFVQKNDGMAGTGEYLVLRTSGWVND